MNPKSSVNGRSVDRTLAKNHNMDDYIENILAENLTLQRKLESKCEALLILSKEVNTFKNERDNLKITVDNMKRQQISLISEPDSPSVESTRALRFEIETLRQKLRDALGDVQALRCRMTQDRSSSACSDSINLRREEELVEQIEDLQRKKMQLDSDLQALLDEKQELVTERDAYKCKLHRLNHECNILLKGNSGGLIDLDALVMENRLLQERLLQAQEENELAKQVADRYKNMLQAKKKKSSSAGAPSDQGFGMVLSQKQVKEFLESCGTTDVPGVEANLSDIRSLCFALLDSLSDKTLALSHQRKANRILAARIAELQSRLDSLQMPQRQAVVSPSAALLEGYKLADNLGSGESLSSDEASLISKELDTTKTVIVSDGKQSSINGSTSVRQ